MHKLNLFSLIELLIVLAILLIIISLFQPALSKVQNQAVTMSCLNNYRVIGKATGLYLGDNSDFFVGTTTDEGAFDSAIYWGRGTLSGGRRRDYKAIYDYFYIGDKKVFFCPAGPETRDPFAFHNTARRNQFVSSSVFKKHNNSYQGVYSVTNPSNIIFSMDSWDKTSGKHLDAKAWKISFRHEQKTNASFIDGHAESIDIFELFQNPTAYLDPGNWFFKNPKFWSLELFQLE